MRQVGHLTPGIGCCLGWTLTSGSKTNINARIKPKPTTKPKYKTCDIFKLDDITSSDNPVISTYEKITPLCKGKLTNAWGLGGLVNAHSKLL